MRIGLHIGDIAKVDQDVFGDGVNFATRLQEIAEPGAVALSDPVYLLLDGTLRPSFEDAVERTLKNIPSPIRVWSRGGEEAGQTATLKHGGFPELIIRPVVSTDQRAEVQDLATAITGDLALQLDAVRDFSARVSQQPQMGQYELKTSLRASGERLRLEAQLFAPDGSLVDALKLDGDLSDIFDWQDRVASELAGRVIQAAFKKEANRIEAIPKENRSADQWACLGVALQD
jgi:TolB-like protein